VVRYAIWRLIKPSCTGRGKTNLSSLSFTRGQEHRAGGAW
jgi:hypothetical protein